MAGTMRAWVAWTLALGIVLGASSASAFYPWRIPNGYTNRTAATGGRCGVCHVDPAGGGTLTVFGTDFSNNGHTWNRELAERDSDGDGWSNGQELGDPFALWTAGSGTADPPPPAVPVYPSTYMANPGVRASQPSDSSTHPCSSAARHDCDSNASCGRTASNGIGDWRCTCDAGYEPTARNGYTRSNLHDFTQNVNGNDLYNILSFSAGCQEVDCSPNPCGVGTCSDRSPPQTYVCNCPAGYVFSSGTCVVSDPCTAGTHDCDPNATCDTVTTREGWSCTCNTGYRGVGDRFRGTGDMCVDIDECAPEPCGAGHRCAEGPPGTYECFCLDGYEVVGGTCVDIDECAGPNGCDANATCMNVPGDYVCTCNAGWEGSGFLCTDVDECAVGGACHEDATCTNTPGGVSCACNEGYVGDGVTCADVDDCGTIVCGPNEVCENQLGAPGICVCALGYVLDESDGRCVPACGDGARTPGEECDDGNDADGDGCSSLCDIEEGYACLGPPGELSVCEDTCGDGLIHVDAGEECDDAEANSDTEPDACRTTCRRASCGDGVVDSDEECDDGDARSDELADACRTTCVMAYCGDGVVDTGEACDPGGGAALPAGACEGVCEALDGGLGPDAGAEAPTDGGCSCRAGGGAPGAPWGVWFGLLAACWVRRRRARAATGASRG